MDLPRLDDLDFQARCTRVSCASTSTSRSATAGSRTISASRRLSRRSMRCGHETRRSSCAAISGARRVRPTRSTRWLPSPRVSVSCSAATFRSRREWWAPQSSRCSRASVRARSGCSRTFGSNRGRPATTRVRGVAVRHRGRVRQRGVRRVAPVARVDRRTAASAPERRGAAARARGRGAVAARSTIRRGRSSPCSAARRSATSSA